MYIYAVIKWKFKQIKRMIMHMKKVKDKTPMQLMVMFKGFEYDIEKRRDNLRNILRNKGDFLKADLPEAIDLIEIHLTDGKDIIDFCRKTLRHMNGRWVFNRLNAYDLKMYRKIGVTLLEEYDDWMVDSKESVNDLEFLLSDKCDTD